MGNKDEKNNTVIDSDLDFNKKNREDYENLMADSSSKLDGYWDKKNPFVILILVILLAIIVVGSIYYISAYMGK
ncbi:MAG: hypothetical protein IJJ63_00755 [Bacilli bacterium]|nr:hypothetical protein [Bacilli bacterium]